MFEGLDREQKKFIDKRLSMLDKLETRLKAHISLLEERYFKGLDYVKAEEEINKLRGLLEND